MAHAPIYFVAGGTGAQGSAVIAQLLKIKPTPVIRTISRNLESPIVKKLQSQGVEVIEGGQDNKGAYKKGVEGAVAAFSVQNVIFSASGIDGEREVSDAQGLVDACKESGTVQFIVHTSVNQAGNYEKYKDFAEKSKMTSYYRGKLGAEAAVRNSGLKYAIVRPCNFASNFFATRATYAAPGLVKLEYYTTTDLLEIIVPDDIGAFVAAAFQNPDKFNGREVDWISESLTAEQIVEALEAASGKKIKLIRLTQEEAEKHPLQGWQMGQFLSNETKNYRTDPEALKREYPEIHFHTFKEYLIKHKDELAVGTAITQP